MNKSYLAIILGCLLVCLAVWQLTKRYEEGRMRHMAVYLEMSLKCSDEQQLRNYVKNAAKALKDDKE